MKSLLSSIVLWSLFLVGLSATVASGAVLDGTQKDVATYCGIALSLVAGSRIAKKDPIKSFLSSRPVLWFLFLFNGVVAAAAGFALDGVQGITAAAGMGLVSLGAGFGLLQSRGTRNRGTENHGMRSRGTENRETQALETQGRRTPTPA
ncbi:hypothetical protein GCM10010317_099180 [Streptomyces mirabilis]|uniref:hypothetical protein n=1 Tax=Streptomyces mirabilis TaxID=68239 RepID=UPI00167DA2CC|nr:hypothetical protein [Streptomyces mirabilis]GHD79036.1 hypothetical protein GCM10010317_099180 [Streptomyces mirabilis]